MSLMDLLLNQFGRSIDVAGIASHLGIDPAVANQAVAALGQAHMQDGDTVETAAIQTGLEPQLLVQIVKMLGGLEGLGAVAQVFQDNPKLASKLSDGAESGAGEPLQNFAKGLFRSS